MINNSINMLSTQRDTCKIKLKEKIGQEIMEECELFIKTRREARHFKTMSRQKRKFESLCQKISSKKGGHSNNIHSGNTVNLIPGRGDCSNQNINNNIISDHSDVQDIEGTQDTTLPPPPTTTTTNKWAINISDKPLTDAEEKLLAHGHNFVVVPRNPPIIQYVAAVKQACTKLEQGNADEFRVQVKVTIQKIQKPEPNITKEGRIALTKLKKDPSRMVLTADKGVALVIMNTEDYKKKAEDLLEQQHTYRPMASDPTMRLKNKLITLLKSIKAKGGIKEELYIMLYPTGAGSPKFYGLPKICKVGMPLRPIVSSIVTVTYETSKELARILKPLVGKSPHKVKNTQDFIQQIKGIYLNKSQCMMFYDVKALFTSVTITPAINIIKKLLEDHELQHRTSMTVKNLICLLEFCLNSTYFMFQGKCFEQLEGAAMGHP